MTVEHAFQFVVGLLIGIFGTLSTSYLLFQSKGGCREMQEGCVERNKILHSQTSAAVETVLREIKDLRQAIEGLREDLEELTVKVDRKITALVFAMPVSDEKKQEMLRGL